MRLLVGLIGGCPLVLGMELLHAFFIVLPRRSASSPPSLGLDLLPRSWRIMSPSRNLIFSGTTSGCSRAIWSFSQENQVQRLDTTWSEVVSVLTILQSRTSLVAAGKIHIRSTMDFPVERRHRCLYFPY